MFDAIAGRYDLLNHLLSAGIDRRWRKRAIQALSLTGVSACWICAPARRIWRSPRSRRGRRPREWSASISRGRCCASGRTKSASGGSWTAFALVRGDATRIPLGDGVVDAITIGFGIRNVEDTASACDEMRRVLAPGGRLAILEFAIPIHAGRADPLFVVLQPCAAARRTPDFPAQRGVCVSSGVRRRVRIL